MTPEKILLVEHRGGAGEMKVARLKKTIYSLLILCELMAAANQQYLEFVSAMENPTLGIQNLDKTPKPVEDGQRTYRGFNLFHGEGQVLFEAIVRGEFTILGFQNRLLRLILVDKSGSQISRMLKRLRMHGLIKKVHGTYKYSLTRLGRKGVTTALKLKTMFIIPSLAESLKIRQHKFMTILTTISLIKDYAFPTTWRRKSGPCGAA